MFNYNDVLLMVFILITVPCFTYWMGYRSGEKSGQMNLHKNFQDKATTELDAPAPLSDHAM